MSNGDHLWITAREALPAAPGAYVLRLELPRPVDLPPRFAAAGCLLPAGVHLYCGSAHGPGGLRARCGRHMAAEKARRWHIDWLTTVAASVAVWPVPGGDECALAAALTAAGCTAPVPGFGASDCRRCVSHLLACPVELDVAAVLRKI